LDSLSSPHNRRREMVWLSTETMSILEEEMEQEKMVQLVVFRLCDEMYGVEILDVWEIVTTGEITIVPNSPDFLRGIINFRSNIVAVIDLEKRFRLHREGENIGDHVMIVRIGNSVFGLLVDEVTDVLRLPEEEIRAPPAIITEKIGIDFVKGVGTLEDRLIILLDLEKVLDEKELIELMKTSDMAAGEATPSVEMEVQKLPEKGT